MSLATETQAFVANQEFEQIKIVSGKMSIQAQCAGTMTGSLKIQVSNNGVNWHDIEDENGAIETELVDNGCLIILDEFYTQYVRPVYIGTDTGSVVFSVFSF